MSDNSDNLDIGGKKGSIELLPENLTTGRELLPSDIVIQIGEKTGMSDKKVRDMFPKLKDFQGRVHFENIKNSENRAIGVFIVGNQNGEEVFRYKMLYVNGKYVKADE